MRPASLGKPVWAAEGTQGNVCRREGARVTASLSSLEVSVSSSGVTVDYSSGTIVWITGGKSAKAASTVPGTKDSRVCWLVPLVLLLTSACCPAHILGWAQSFVYADLALCTNGFLQRCISVGLISHRGLHLKCLPSARAHGLTGEGSSESPALIPSPCDCREL